MSAHLSHLSHLTPQDAVLARAIDTTLDGCDRFIAAVDDMTSPEANASWLKLIADCRGETEETEHAG